MRIPTADDVLSGDRAALARAITLLESTRPDHARIAATLIDELLPHTGNAKRIGVSGTPGVGKSTFIESLGRHLTEAGERVAVLAIDPSSTRTGGSILGDRTRMPELSRNPNAYIRSSPSSGALGGVAEQTYATRLLCEAAGFSVVLIETVGVGQSETTVAELTDLFLLLVAPGGGDALQGIKRGVMELADVIAINKSDGPQRRAAERTANEYRSALSLLRPKWKSQPSEVMLCSALEELGIDELWCALTNRWNTLDADGDLFELRRSQAVAALRRHVSEGMRQLLSQGHIRDRLEDLEAQVAAGSISPRSAAALALRGLATPEQPERSRTDRA